MVDRAALEMRSTRKRTGGSNPSLSAIPLPLPFTAVFARPWEASYFIKITGDPFAAVPTRLP